ncbi:MAG: GNAT family N-acetyltransferase [Bacilli bacterium]|nr:GNAT family N-acetyltransferase [Bacilli bacterium]
MVYKTEDYSIVQHLFGDWPFSYWPTVMNQKVKIYADDPIHPESAVGFLGRWAYCAGKPNKALITRKEREWLCLFPQNRKWKKLIEECFPDAERWTRFAIKHDASFDKGKLQSMVDALPEGYELKKIDSEIYDLCQKADDEDVEELVGWFDGKEQFLELGIGYAVLKDGNVVGGASTAYRFPSAIDIEVDVDKKHRRKGLASAASAKLILDCLDRGWKPTWDAANMKSVHLSEKLGYTFSHKYRCYSVSPVFFKAVKRPDKSKWESYCGKYETNCKTFKLKEVWMQDGDLYGLASNEVRRNFKFKFYPIGKNVFGRRDGIVRVTFGENQCVIGGHVCKKLP